jgi:hypothetical protein
VAVSTGNLRIVSGGQSGVDRGALDAALALGCPCGGWCPEGRLAEDGPIPARYPLRELPGGGYRARTRCNVRDSDATLIVTFGTPTGGTAATLDDCRALGRPVLVIDGDAADIATAAEHLGAFLAQQHVAVLNVAGPRASGHSRAYAYARALLERHLSGAAA